MKTLIASGPDLRGAYNVYKSFAVAPAGAEVTDAEELYTSYVEQELEAETSSPTIQDQQDLIDAAESFFSLPIELICYDGAPEVICLVKIAKSSPTTYYIDIHMSGRRPD